MIKCKEAAVLISQDIDREISFGDRIKLRVHLVICSVCRRLREQLLVQQEAAEMANDQSYPQVPQALSMRPESRERIKAKMRDKKNPPSV